MKSKIFLTTLSLLLIFGAASSVSALPQQQPGPVSAEKKRVMSKFDPTDLFPEAKDRNKKERARREKNSAQGSILASTASSGAETTVASRRNSRRHRSEPTGSANSEAKRSANAPSAPTDNAATPVPSPSLVAIQKAEPTPDATPSESPSPSAVMGGAAALTSPPSQTLLASSKAPAETSPRSQPSQNSWLSLPTILTLLSLVALALIFALVKLMKQFRGSVN
jgi:hypothetical protein